MISRTCDELFQGVCDCNEASGSLLADLSHKQPLASAYARLTNRASTKKLCTFGYVYDLSTEIKHELKVVCVEGPLYIPQREDKAYAGILLSVLSVCLLKLTVEKVSRVLYYEARLNALLNGIKTRFGMQLNNAELLLTAYNGGL